MELEERLLYAPYMELKSWFDTIRNGTNRGGTYNEFKRLCNSCPKLSERRY